MTNSILDAAQVKNGGVRQPWVWVYGVSMTSHASVILVLMNSATQSLYGQFVVALLAVPLFFALLHGLAAVSLWLAKPRAARLLLWASLVGWATMAAVGLWYAWDSYPRIGAVNVREDLSLLALVQGPHLLGLIAGFAWLKRTPPSDSMPHA